MILVVLLAAAVIAWLLARTSDRLRQLELRAGDAERRAADLTRRVFQLEEARRAEPLAPAPPTTTAEVPPPPVVLDTPPPAAAVPPREEVQPEAQVPVAAVPASENIEELIGGNWLSKAGIVVLLIGLALMLGYSLVSLGPAGKIATAAAASLGLLGAGAFAERRREYATLGRALLGGGWAGLYLTAYAAHGIPAARVIENPGAGFLLLLSVAGGMILHSLRYGSETVTGLAFLAAYISIAVSSLTQFSAIASIPLLISLLAVSWRFGWGRLAAAGAVFAYAAHGFDLATGDKDRYFTVVGEPVLWAYWFLLELFDLAALRRPRSGESFYFPVAPFNLCGFVMATAAVWPSSGWDPGPLYATMAIAQLLSSLLRGRRSPDGDLEDFNTWAGFRASLTFAAAFSTAFLFERFTRFPLAAGLAMQAQMLALSGWLLRSSYLRGLAAVLFALPFLVALHAASLGGPRELWWWHKPMLALAGLGILNRLFLQGGPWYSFGAALAAAAFFLPMEQAAFRPLGLTVAAGAASLLLRWKAKPESAYVGTLLALLSASVLLADIPRTYLPLTLGFPALLYAVLAMTLADGMPRLGAWSAMHLFLAAWLYRVISPDSGWLLAAWAGQALAACWTGSRMQSWTLAASAWVGELALVSNWLLHWTGREEALAARAVAVCILLALHVAAVPRSVEAAGGRLGPRLALWWHGASGAALLTWLVADAVSGRRLTLAWSLEAFSLLGAGFGFRSRQLRIAGLILFACCLLKLFLHDFSELDMVSRIASFLGLGLLLLATSWVYTRFKDQIRRYL